MGCFIWFSPGFGESAGTPPGRGGWIWREPLCDIPSGGCFFTGPWTVTRSSLRMLRRVAAFCRPLRPVLLLVSFPRSRSPVVGVLGLCWMWRDVPFARQRRPIVGVPTPPPPCVTFRRVAVSLRGPGQSPVLPFACCVGSPRSVGRCGWCSCWCRFCRGGVPPCVTFRLVVASVRGPGQSSVRPFACCVGSLRSVSRCGRQSPPPPPQAGILIHP